MAYDARGRTELETSIESEPRTCWLSPAVLRFVKFGGRGEQMPRCSIYIYIFAIPICTVNFTPVPNVSKSTGLRLHEFT